MSRPSQQDTIGMAPSKRDLRRGVRKAPLHHPYRHSRSTLPAPGADATASAPPAPPATSTWSDHDNLCLFDGPCPACGRRNPRGRRSLCWFCKQEHTGSTGSSDCTQHRSKDAPAVKVAHWLSLPNLAAEGARCNFRARHASKISEALRHRLYMRENPESRRYAS